MRKLLFGIPYFFSVKPSRNASATRSATLEEPDADRILSMRRIAGYQHCGSLRGGGLSLRAKKVDPERSGIIGICGWGGMIINAAVIDTRIICVRYEKARKVER